MSSDQETVFLSTPDVTVTRSRFVVPGQTFAMSGITSVSRGIIQPSRRGAVICIALGAFGLLAAFTGSWQPAVAGGILFAIGLIWLSRLKPTHLVKLNTAGAETRAFASKDEDAVDEIVDALNDAIITRG